MKVRWQEVEDLSNKNLGDGVQFYMLGKEGQIEPLAFLEGYEWYHGSPEEVVIEIRKASEFKNQAIIKDVKNDIEAALNEDRLWQRKISSLVYAWFNA
jgi:hypothetical protein